MTEKTDSILIFTGSEAAVSGTEKVGRGLSDAMKGVAAKASEVTVNTLQENMHRFLSSLDIIIKSSPKDVGGLTLDEVEIYAQIDSKGNVGISGIASAEFATQGGVKFVLRNKL